MDAGHGLVTLLSLSGRLRTDRCISHRGKSQTYYPEHILLVPWVQAGHVLGFYFGGGGHCTALSLGLRGGGLESQFGRGPGHPGQEGDGLVLFVPWV